MAGRWETVEEDTPVDPRFDRDPSPSFSALTPTYTHRQWKRDFDGGRRQPPCRNIDTSGWLLRLLKGESRTAAEVVMDEALVQDDCADLIAAELD